MDNFHLSQFLNKGMVLLVVPKNSVLYLSQNYTIAWKEEKFYIIITTSPPILRQAKFPLKIFSFLGRITKYIRIS